MVNENRYMIWCNQRNQYFGDNSEFKSLAEVKGQLVSYHEVDSEEDLSGWDLSDYLDCFEWEVHDLEGNIVLVDDELQQIVEEKLEKIKDEKEKD